MGIIVQKFGGTSVGDPEKIKNVAKRVFETKNQGNQMVVVVSAMGHSTDILIDLANQITDNPSEREMDMLLSTGEQVSIALLAMALHSMGSDAVSFTGHQIGFETNCVHNKASIKKIGTEKIREHLNKNEVVIVAGFQGITNDCEITTLGRGGSDLTAVALAAVLNAEVCEIFTDVDGVYTSDPRIITKARKIDRISYDEMLELASLGAKVLHARSVELGKKYKVPIHVRSTFVKQEGTMIVEEADEMEDVLISGVVLNEDEVKVKFAGVPDRLGIAASMFKKLANNNVNVDMIVQNIGDKGHTDITFTIMKEDLKKILAISKEIVKEIGAKDFIIDEDIAVVSVVGVGMRRHVGVAAKMFEVFAENNINIQMISTSEIRISCVIAKNDAKEAARKIHTKFGLDK